MIFILSMRVRGTVVAGVLVVAEPKEFEMSNLFVGIACINLYGCYSSVNNRRKTSNS